MNGQQNIKIYTECDHSTLYLYYDHTVYSFPLYTFLWPEDSPQWPKHVVVSIINRTQDSCVLTYPTPSLIAYNTTGMMHLKTVKPLKMGLTGCAETSVSSGVPRNFVRGVQQIQLRTEDGENRDLPWNRYAQEVACGGRQEVPNRTSSIWQVSALLALPKWLLTVTCNRMPNLVFVIMSNTVCVCLMCDCPKFQT